MTNPSQEAVVEAFDVFLDQYTGKHDKDNWLKNTLYADTVQVRKDLIIKQFREVLTTFAQTIREEERERILGLVRGSYMHPIGTKPFVVLEALTKAIEGTPTTNHTGETNQ